MGHLSITARAVSAARIDLSFPDLSDDDIEDMYQEAEIAAWRCQGKPVNYIFRAARNAVVQWYMMHILGWRYHCNPPTLLTRPVSLSDDYTPQLAIDNEPRGPLSDEVMAELIAKLQEMGYTPAKSTRLAQVLSLKLQGYSADGIGLELGIPTRKARNNLSEIRGALKKML